MEWGSGALALACLAAGVLHLVRLVTLRREVVGEMSHAAMAFGMAAMASPLGDPVPEPFWTAVYVLVAAWFVVLVLRTRSTGGDAVHHVLGSGAMLFMLAADHSAGHGATGGGALLGLVPVTAVALTGYFAWHALRCADRWRRGREPGHCEPGHCEPGHCEPSGTVLTLRSPVLSACTPQAGAAGHLVAAVAMSAMLLGMI